MQDSWESEKMLNVEKQNKSLICLMFTFFSAVKL